MPLRHPRSASLLLGALLAALALLWTPHAFAQGAPNLSALVDPINDAGDDAEESASFLSVRVDSELNVDLFATNADLLEVLQQLAVQSRRNIVPESSVQGRVTANLSGVPLLRAVDVVLAATGYIAQERDGFIFVTRDAAAGVLELSVSEYLTVDLTANAAELLDVLQRLALESNRNIVPSPGVMGQVTANVRDAPFYDALEAVLHANGFGYIERGDFIFVYPYQELQAIGRVANRPDTRVVKLDYMLAEDAIRFATPLLSPEGRVEATIDPVEATGDTSSTLGGSESGDIDDPVYAPDENRYSLANAVVIYDYPDFADEVEELLRSLDTSPAQVLIEATVLQTTLDEANAFGVDFAFLPDVQLTDFFGFGSIFNPIGFDSEDPASDTAPAAPAPQNRSFTTVTAGNTGGGEATVRAGIMIEDEIGIFIRALDRVSDVSLLSNPKVMTLNRQRARIFVGARVGYTTSSQSGGDLFGNTVEIQFINEGIELDFRPFIQEDDTVRLELSPRISDVTFTQQSSATGLIDVPTQALQIVSTHVTVPKGTTAVLGGLFTEDTTVSRQQVPILGDMPLVGGAFRGHDDMTMRSEIIFLIKPTIMSEAQQVRVGDEAEATVDAVRVGTRQGLLFWSKEQQTSRLNVEAERLAAEGKVEEALWALRRSLELKPNQPDAVRLREELINEPNWWPSRSMLDRIARAHVDAMLSEQGRQANADEWDAQRERAAARLLFEEAEYLELRMHPLFNLVPVLPPLAEGEGGEDEGDAEGGEGEDAGASQPSGTTSDSNSEDAPELPDLPETPDIPEIPGLPTP
ncbi:MAG: hypothetical protein AAGI30_00540 [Planctomycetota bacterium]